MLRRLLAVAAACLCLTPAAWADGATIVVTEVQYQDDAPETGYYSVYVWGTISFYLPATGVSVNGWCGEDAVGCVAWVDGDPGQDGIFTCQLTLPYETPLDYTFYLSGWSPATEEILRGDTPYTFNRARP